MRMLCVSLLLSQMTSPHAERRASTVEQLRRFEVGEAHCVTQEVQMNATHESPADTVFTLACNGKQLVRRDLGLADISPIAVSLGIGPVIVTVPSAAGLTSGLFVVEVSSTPAKTEAKIIFEHVGGAGAESFDSGDVIFANFGRRLLGNLILPETTDVYWLQNGAYEFHKSYTWSETASWADRYCILLNAKACPATTKDKPTEDKTTYTRVVPRAELPAAMTQPRLIP